MALWILQLNHLSLAILEAPWSRSSMDFRARSNFKATRVGSTLSCRHERHFHEFGLARPRGRVRGSRCLRKTLHIVPAYICERPQTVRAFVTILTDIYHVHHWPSRPHLTPVRCTPRHCLVTPRQKSTKAMIKGPGYYECHGRAELYLVMLSPKKNHDKHSRVYKRVSQRTWPRSKENLCNLSELSFFKGQI